MNLTICWPKVFPKDLVSNNASQKVEAVRLLRSLTGMSLKEAVDEINGTETTIFVSADTIAFNSNRFAGLGCKTKISGVETPETTASSGVATPAPTLAYCLKEAAIRAIQEDRLELARDLLILVLENQDVA